MTAHAPLLLNASRLERLVAAIFAAAGSEVAEAAAIARHLVASNLVGHESHGVLRVPLYLSWLREGIVLANRRGHVVLDAGALCILDGEHGFGQVIGERALALGIGKARAAGVGLFALRRCGHLGRIGGWAEMAAAEGLASLLFVNSPGTDGAQVAPFGSRERRLAPNPLAIGVPRAGGPPLVLDITTSVVPEGKVRAALNQGALLPEGAMVDAAGRPSRDPAAYYGPPPGALLPVGGHKGSGLCIMVDLLAGALTDGGCAGERTATRGNNMLAILIDPARLELGERLGLRAADLAAWVRSAAPIEPGGEVLVPGEREARLRALRREQGVPLDPATWSQIEAAARGLGLDPAAEF